MMTTTMMTMMMNFKWKRSSFRGVENLVFTTTTTVHNMVLMVFVEVYLHIICRICCSADIVPITFHTHGLVVPGSEHNIVLVMTCGRACKAAVGSGLHLFCLPYTILDSSWAIIHDSWPTCPSAALHCTHTLCSFYSHYPQVCWLFIITHWHEGVSFYHTALWWEIC